MLLLFAFFAWSLGHGNVDHSSHGYRFNGPLQIECANRNGTFSTEHAPQCINTKKPLSFNFGIDTMMSCVMHFTPEQVAWLIELIQQKENWNCRCIMTPGHEVYIPFTIPIWGVVEASHIHVDNHLNFVFHAWRGSVVAVAAYPLRDQFAYIDRRLGGTLSIHGHVKFFQGESFQPLSLNGFVPQDPHAAKERMSLVWTVALWSIISFFLTLMGATWVFVYKLKPDIIEKEKGKRD